MAIDDARRHRVDTHVDRSDDDAPTDVDDVDRTRIALQQMVGHLLRARPDVQHAREVVATADRDQAQHGVVLDDGPGQGRHHAVAPRSHDDLAQRRRLGNLLTGVLDVAALDDVHLGTRRAEGVDDRSSSDGRLAAARVRIDDDAEAAVHGIRMPGFITPCGSTEALTARSMVTPTGPISSANHFLWSRPTA